MHCSGAPAARRQNAKTAFKKTLKVCPNHCLPFPLPHPPANKLALRGGRQGKERVIFNSACKIKNQHFFNLHSKTFCNF